MADLLGVESLELFDTVLAALALLGMSTISLGLFPSTQADAAGSSAARQNKPQSKITTTNNCTDCSLLRWLYSR